MASRRTRIKGIANIPQRRKTVNNTTNEEENEKLSPEIEEEKPNLKEKHEVVLADSQVEEPKKENVLVKTEDQNHENISNVKIEETEPVLPEKVPNPLVSENSEKIDEKTNITVTTENETFPEKPPVPVRRKFIKPAVSLNAINRKPKEAEDVRFVSHPVNGGNNKIVILNEVITYPNQTHPVVIHDHQYGKVVVSEVQDSLLKPPDAYNGRPFVNTLERDIKRLTPSPQILPTEDYPRPPPSPNKINRSRIKAVPRLGQRNTSFSASESEDEGRRNYRHRNDSVCSSTSGIQDTNSIPECPSPQKVREFNSVIQRKCRRTEQSRKLAEARRDFYLKFGNKTPDRQKLTMIDLIFYNPTTNPMPNDNKNKRKLSEAESEPSEDVKKTKIEEEAVDEPGKTGSDEENDIPAPQIKIGPQGELILDEQSLVIENKAVKKGREEIEKSEIVNGDFETGYGVYKRAKRSKDWSKQETVKFYKALNTIGTDFTLMCELFPRRSRRELKMKFKKEERVNKALVDKAIMQPCGFDFNDFKHEVDMEEKELQEIQKQTEREKMLKSEAKKQRAAIKKETAEKLPKIEKPKLKKKKKDFNIMNVLDDSDADESEVESVEDEEVEDGLLPSLQKPTRSGRVPKLLERYQPPVQQSKPMNAKPGSLIVAASTGENGQPVYKVFMVTGQNGRQQIGKDMNSLDKALECKENGITNLFTLTATTTLAEPENNQTIPAEENNITIPAGDEICMLNNSEMLKIEN